MVRTLQRAPKPIDMRLTAAPDDAVVFETPKAKLGDIEVHFTGRLSISGKATLEGEEAPKKGQRGWANTRVRDLAKATIQAQAPTGTDRHVELEIGGEKLVLDLAQGLTGLPPFAISGRFGGARNLTFGTASVAGLKAKQNAAVGLDATAWITPAASKPGATPPPPVGDAAVSNFTWAGDKARFEDTHGPEDKPIERSGTLALWDSIRQLERDLPAFVKGHKFLALPEQRVAFLQEMRAYFGDDAKTIAHFKRLRKVKRGGKETGLILHDEAATRLEAVEAEIGTANMPSTDVGWPRSECTLGGLQQLSNLHNLGFAVDFNATELPHIKSSRDLDLIRLVTGKVEMETGGTWHTTGDYDAMAAKTEQRAVMEDPDPASKLGQLLAKVESETTAISERSERFRHSLDVAASAGTAAVDGQKEMADLRKAYLASIDEDHPNPAAWGDTEKAAFARLTVPWKTIVDKEVTGSAAKVQAAGFTPTAVAKGKALDAEEKAVKAAAQKAAALRKAVKGDELGKRRAEAEKLLAGLRTLLGKPGTTEPKDLADAALLTELDELKAAADTRLGGYGKARWHNRLTDLRSGLDDPSWVLGTSGKAVVKDPAPAQLLSHGYFTLKQNSTSAPGGKAQPGAFDVAFVKAMVKHGFNHGGNWGTPDFMHFELRWTGPAKKKP
jgi:hypothetical protein